jgi:hypothetical protein
MVIGSSWHPVEIQILIGGIICIAAIAALAVMVGYRGAAVARAEQAPMPAIGG